MPFICCGRPSGGPRQHLRVLVCPPFLYRTRAAARVGGVGQVRLLGAVGYVGEAVLRFGGFTLKLKCSSLPSNLSKSAGTMVSQFISEVTRSVVDKSGYYLRPPVYTYMQCTLATYTFLSRWTNKPVAH